MREHSAARLTLSALRASVTEQLGLLAEVDRLKTVLRQSPLAAARRGNDAEHPWHPALMVLVLAEYSDEPIDVGHAVALVVVHDLVEVHAGDTPPYDDGGRPPRRSASARRPSRCSACCPPARRARCGRCGTSSRRGGVRQGDAARTLIDEAERRGLLAEGGGNPAPVPG